MKGVRNICERNRQNVLEKYLEKCMKEMCEGNVDKREMRDLVWFGWVLWHINLCRLFNAKSIFM